VITELLGGRVDYYIRPISAGRCQIRDGKAARRVRVSQRQASSCLRDVPRWRNPLPGFEFTLWFACGGAGMPAEVVDRYRRSEPRPCRPRGARAAGQLGKIDEMTPARI